MKFLCDTNVLSEVMRRSPNPEVKSWLNQQEFLYLSAITVEEISAGLTYKDAKRQREWFENLLTFRAEVLAITSTVLTRSFRTAS
ncbi:MAG: type II toxin-antitoxin system VapC family toxin [bacterium]|nr:type II toxin-antitoxin system VapC family toxin [bacterium]